MPGETLEYAPSLTGTGHVVSFQLVDKAGNLSEEKVIRFPPSVSIDAPLTQSSGAIAGVKIHIDGPAHMKVKKIELS